MRQGVSVAMAVVGDDERDELRIAPGRFRAIQFGVREFPFGRPGGPQIFAKGNGFGLERCAAALGVEIPLIPVGSDLRRRFALSLEH